MPRLLLFLAILTTAPILRADWQIVDKSPAQSPEFPLIYEQKEVSDPDDTGLFSGAKRIDLVWFNDKDYTFRVIDNGAGSPARYPDLPTALRENDCLAGVNGGFFLKDNAPSGLQIASGRSLGKFGTGGLLSGVVLSSGNINPYLLRRAEYDAAKYKATDLIQAGPFLVDQGSTVRGLSPDNSRRRSFVLHDGGDWFALGMSDPFSLAELGKILAKKEFSPSRKIHRALNLDGGTSSGIFIDRGEEAGNVYVEPFKQVRNYLGIRAREE